MRDQTVSAGPGERSAVEALQRPYEINSFYSKRESSRSCAEDDENTGIGFFRVGLKYDPNGATLAAASRQAILLAHAGWSL